MSKSPDCRANDHGVDARRFYDARLKQFIVVSRKTTAATHEDLRILKYSFLFPGDSLRRAPLPFVEGNVFGADRRMRGRLVQRKARVHLEAEEAALAARLAEHQRLMSKLLCRNCGRGHLHHAGDKCLFESTEWEPGGVEK